MDLYDFHFMATDIKAEAVWVHGTFLAIRADGDHYVALYYMGSFFVEVWFNPMAYKIAFMIGFRSDQFLEPYLQLIDISEAAAA